MNGRTQMVFDAFTIDDHRARSRHFDLRLTVEGSETLWAMASEMPAPGAQAQLAICIELPPLAEHGGLPPGSDRTSWDHGRMTVSTWHEGEAAVVTLHGTCGGGLGGARTVSLRHVGSPGDDDDHWSIVALDRAP